MSVNEKMTAIADAIRDKTGREEKLGLDAMAAGVGEVYEAGKGDFVKNMDSLSYFFINDVNMGLLNTVLNADLSSIKRSQYVFMDNTAITEFVLPKTLRPTLVHGMFQRATNLVRVSGFEALPVSVLTDLFNGCTSLVDCGTLNFAGVGYVNRAFQNCTALKEIRITGDIRISVSFANSSLLSNASVHSIIDHLKDLTGSTAQTLTFHAEVGASLTDVQKAAITAKNWTLVY